MQRYIIAFVFCVYLAVGQGGAHWSAVSAADPPDMKRVEAALTKVAEYSYGRDFSPLAEIAAAARGAKGDAATLGALETRFIAFLKSDASPEGRRFICEQLSVIGSAASVPTLADMLASPATADMARYALERLQVPQAAEALRASLPKTTGKEQVGVIVSLGRKRDRESVSLLGPFISSADRALAAAAVNALGEIGDASAMKVLAEARKSLTGLLREDVTDAYLRCAEQAGLRGEKERALAAYAELMDPAEPLMIRVAALRGRVALQGANGFEPVAKALQSEEPLLRATAIELLGAMPGEEPGRALADSYPNFPPAAKAQLLHALIKRGDASARSLLSEGLKDESPVVRIAALEGIGKIGDASQVMMLAEVAAGGSKEEQAAARQSLYALSAAGVDEAVVDNLASAPPKVKVELITAAGERRLEGAAGSLLSLASSPDPDLAKAARRALAETAQPKDIGALIKLLEGSTEVGPRAELQRAIVATLRRHEMAGVDQVVAVAETGSGEGRIQLLSILGQVGHPDGLRVLRAALNDSNPDVQRAAILAFGEWPTTEALPQLLEIAKTTSAPNLQALAVRSYLRIVSRPARRPRAETVKLLEPAMAIAQDSEKKMILAVLPRVTCPEAIKLAESQKGTSVSKEAEAALQRMTGGGR